RGHAKPLNSLGYIFFDYCFPEDAGIHLVGKSSTRRLRKSLRGLWQRASGLVPGTICVRDRGQGELRF
ncbi:MAG TPA: hypothetical protein VN066_05965, partial [Rhodocyclaceae bacterium]|nr:hypothetical protein [Rhodocyclaceae bacterium]